METRRLALLVLVMVGSGLAGPCHAEDVAPPRGAEEAWKADIQKALSRKVSFEFVDTPLAEALVFLKSLARINMVVDPALAADANNVQVNLRVADMSMDKALEWLCKLAGAKYELRDQAVFITSAEPAKPKPAPATLEVLTLPRKPAEAEPTRACKVRVKLPDGTEFEAEGVSFDALRSMARESLDRSLDRAKDGVLAFRVTSGDAALKRLLELLGQVAPSAKLDYHADLQLLIVMGKEPTELRRAESVMHALMRPPLALTQAAKYIKPAEAVAPAPAPALALRPSWKEGANILTAYDVLSGKVVWKVVLQFPIGQVVANDQAWRIVSADGQKHAVIDGATGKILAMRDASPPKPPEPPPPDRDF